MNCFDCATTGDHNPAVAICIDCGAGECLDHTVVTRHNLNRVRVINRIETVEPAARLIYCKTCATAHDAVASAGHH
ncbi:MAG: DUF2180 family protein [Ilumatobacteraceae bacterium]|nr:DUF2180 family protein [Ilumatobacteraceae bacterium]